MKEQNTPQNTGYPLTGPDFILKNQTDTTISVVEFPTQVPWNIRPNTDKLLESIGYVLDDNKVVIIELPTPATVEERARTLGVEIEFFSEMGQLTGNVYLGAFALGKYPVSTYDKEFYKHDIEDDHLTMMVLGGEPLREALKSAAQTAFDSGDPEVINNTAQAIDVMTADLLQVLYGAQGAAYSPENGWNIILKRCEKLGLSEQTCRDILDHAQASCTEFGIPYTPLIRPVPVVREQVETYNPVLTEERYAEIVSSQQKGRVALGSSIAKPRDNGLDEDGLPRF